MITSLNSFTHASLEGVEIYQIGKTSPKRDEPQTVLVQVKPHAEIPMHSHKGDAYMTIVSGSGIVVSDDENNGQFVTMGDRVYFEKEGLHGFRAGHKGLGFVSQNEGIVDQDEMKWDIDFASTPT